MMHCCIQQDEICQIYCHLNCDMIIVNGEIGKILFFRLQKTFENTKQLEKPLCECNLGNYVCKEIREDLKNVIH